MAPMSSIVTDPDLVFLLDTLNMLRDISLQLIDLQSALPPTDSSAAAAATTPNEAEIQYSRAQARLFAYVAQLRTLHRQVTMSVRATKATTAEARREVDALRLQLQNLVYEARHLRGEIKGCLEFSHKYTTLPLISREDFLQAFPDKVGMDENQFMLERIAHEHQERTILEEERLELLKRKMALISENNRRKEDLQNLDKDLEKFIEAADPIVKTFEKDY